jgi:hypothetical protein
MISKEFMENNMINNYKTIWQHIYSFLGFWSYTSVEDAEESGKMAEYRIWYWTMFPFFFIRKFDILRYRIKGPYTMEDEVRELENIIKNHRQRQISLRQEILETHGEDGYREIMTEVRRRMNLVG